MSDSIRVTRAMQTCHSCHKEELKMKWCSNCRGVQYCSTECQHHDWPRHMQKCRSNDFAVNKRFKETISKIMANEGVILCLDALAHHANISGYEYLKVEFEVGWEKGNEIIINTKGTNDTYPVRLTDLYSNKINVIVVGYTVGVYVPTVVLGSDKDTVRIAHESLYQLFDHLAGKPCEARIEIGLDTLDRMILYNEGRKEAPLVGTYI